MTLPPLASPPFPPRTIVYKGMLRSVVVGEFYRDLADEDYETAFAIYHRRFSTNTTPKWPLAQPMRILGHNGGLGGLERQRGYKSQWDRGWAQPAAELMGEEGGEGLLGEEGWGG